MAIITPYTLLAFIVCVATALLPSPPPPPPPPCSSPADCSLNGVCLQRVCVCDPGWIGISCEELLLGDSVAVILDGNGSTASLPLPLRRSWSWGGSPIRDARTGTWHLYFAWMEMKCGLLHYQTNSVVRHAISTSASPVGPWRLLSVPALAPRKGNGVDPAAWDSGAIHGPEIAYDPTTKRYLLFYEATNHSSPMPDCRGSAQPPVVMVSSTRRIGLAWSVSIAEGEEEWHRLAYTAGTRSDRAASSPPHALDGLILSPRASPQWDSGDVSNAAPLVLANGTVLLGYRAGGDGVALGGGIGLARSDDWRTARFLRPGDDAAAEGLPLPAGSPGNRALFAAEDAKLWQGRARGGSGGAAASASSAVIRPLHILAHRFAAKNGSTRGTQVGAHAWSVDGGWTWTLAPSAAYNTTVRWAATDGLRGSSTVTSNDANAPSAAPSAPFTLYRRERPKLVVDATSGTVSWLFNGAWPCHSGPENEDAIDSVTGCESFTIATNVVLLPGQVNKK
tara:strand:- start:1011 stop:2531 length:1521 start_codon:yes stop_codon:yes gene_type:complete